MYLTNQYMCHTNQCMMSQTNIYVMNQCICHEPICMSHEICHEPINISHEPIHMSRTNTFCANLQRLECRSVTQLKLVSQTNTYVTNQYMFCKYTAPRVQECDPIEIEIFLLDKANFDFTFIPSGIWAPLSPHTHTLYFLRLLCPSPHLLHVHILYIRVYTYVCTNMYKYMFVHIYIYIHKHIYIYMYIRICIYIYIHLCMYVYLYI